MRSRCAATFGPKLAAYTEAIDCALNDRLLMDLAILARTVTAVLRSSVAY
jgi:hypothetical protein